MLVVSLPGASSLGATLARALGCDHSALAVHRFPDGESLPRIDVPVAGRSIVFAGSLDRPDTKTLPLLFAADAARELGASSVGLVAPYLAYMRQDRRFKPGEAITSSSYARLLSASLEFVVTVDPHLHRWHSLAELYSIRTRAVASAPAIAAWIASNVSAPLIVGPDEESVQWVSQVAALAGAPFTVMRKTRRGDRDVSVRLDDSQAWLGLQPVLVDDIISTGRTLLAAAQALQASGLPPPLCVGVHALFDERELAGVLGANASTVVTADTIPHPTNRIALGAALAEGVRAVLQP
jgi:ribose-phosphate pyrophosphokinase